LIFIPDTAKKDWVLVIIGVLAAAGFFWFISFSHPLRIADASFGSDNANSVATNKLNDLGFSDTGAYSNTSFKIRSGLLDSLQKKVSLEEFRALEKYDLFNVFYWNTTIESLQPGSRFLNDEGDDGDDETVVTLEVQLNEEGKWLAFNNEQKLIPNRLMNPEALRRAVSISEEDISELNSDSDLLKAVRFNFQPDLNRDEEININRLRFRPHFLNNEQAFSIALYYLEESGWPQDEFEVESVERQIYPGFDAAEVTFLHENDQLYHKNELVLHIAPTGALLHMVPVYSSYWESDFNYNQLITSGRAVLMLIFFIWLLAQLYIRIKLRVVDTRSAILLAVLAGFFIPIISMIEWIYTNMHSIEGPDLMSFFFQLLTMGFLAAFLSTGFFIITAIGDSLVRQHWAEKIRTIDLVRIGHLFNIPVGIAFIRSVSMAFIFAFLFSLLLLILPGSYISLENTFRSDTTYLAPVVELLIILFTSYAVVQTAFMIIMGRLSDKTQNTALMGVTGAIIFSLMGPLQLGFGPVLYEFLLMLAAGFGFGILFAKTDTLTTLLSLFLFVMIVVTADGWVLPNSPDAAIFYYSLLVIAAFLVVGYIGVYKGRSIRELPRYIPDYVDELAQEERIKQELQIARGVQESFLPVRTPRIQKLDLAGICIPAYETGGDYYDFISINEDKLAVAIGDVSGKGIQAAFYMTFIKGVLHALCKENESSISLLGKVNDLFLQNAPRGTFISLIFGVLNSRTGKFVFSRAGHNPLFHYHAKSKKVEEIRPDGIGIGMAKRETFMRNIKESELQLEKDDILVLFTDGVVEANSTMDGQFGDDRLQKVIGSCDKRTSKEIMYNIVNSVKTFSEGTQQHDDMTLVVIKME